MRSFQLAACMACAYLSAGSALAGAECESPSAIDSTWMVETLKQWEDTARNDLLLTDVSIPWVIFFDSTCSWNINVTAQKFSGKIEGNRVASGELILGEMRLPISGYVHDGEILLPEGGVIPPQLILFASTYGSERKPYMVMAMPEIWRSTPHHADDPASELDRLIRSVFVHEMTHTAQSSVFGNRLDEIIEQSSLDDNVVNDDMVQSRFADNPAFSDSVDKERKLLFEAARMEDKDQARALVSRALSMIRQRHAEWLSGENVHLSELEDIFLYMEGTANWAAYQALLDQGMTPENALRVLRRGGQSWTQDEGLAIFLAIDHVLKDWKVLAMSERPGNIFNLLEAAAAESNGH